MLWLQITGSIASILGFVLSAYVLYRETKIAEEVHDFKREYEEDKK